MAVAKDLLGHIIPLREQRVMLSGDLAALYEVAPRVLMQAVKRNGARFPEDFMFQLSRDEWLHLKSHFVISSWGGSRTPPYAFTEQAACRALVVDSEKRPRRARFLPDSPPHGHSMGQEAGEKWAAAVGLQPTIPKPGRLPGVAMLSSVLKSTRAIQVNIEIMRTFVRLRRILSESADLSRRLDDLEQHYDEQFKAVFDALRQLMAPPQKPGRPIGFIQGGQKDTP